MAAWPVCRLRPARLTRNDRQVKHFNALDVARAVENQVVWVSANQHGRLDVCASPVRPRSSTPTAASWRAPARAPASALARIDVRAAVAGRARRASRHLGDRVPVAYGHGTRARSAGHAA